MRARTVLLPGLLSGLLALAACDAPPGGEGAPPGDTAEPQVAPGTVLPYGQVGSACGVADAALGTVIGQAGGFTLYDTAPSSVALRTHYITGMADRCPRQFTAALALFGDITTHELLRYLPGAQGRPYSATDRAYEDIKARVCGVPAGQPCGDRSDRLARQTAFVTVYETFGTNPDWSEILLHDGQVAASGFVGN